MSPSAEGHLFHSLWEGKDESWERNSLVRGGIVKGEVQFVIRSVHHHHIFVYSVVIARNSSHKDKNTQSLKTVNKQYKYAINL